MYISYLLLGYLVVYRPLYTLELERPSLERLPRIGKVLLGPSPLRFDFEPGRLQIVREYLARFSLRHGELGQTWYSFRVRDPPSLPFVYSSNGWWCEVALLLVYSCR